LSKASVDTLSLAGKIRVHALKMTNRAHSSHIGGCLSAADILAVLYGGILNVEPGSPENPLRDRFILSKGHAAAAIYATLAECGFFPVEWLDTFYLDGSRLSGHVTRGIPGVEVSSGSLGHGLPISCGMSLAAKRDNNGCRVFALLSDGECDEGSTWEAALFAGHHRLDNLTAIIDYNKIQSFGMVKEVLDLEPFAEKWRAFGWSAREVDGHSHGQIRQALSEAPFEKDKPSCIIAHTVKGKGVSFMENRLEWHYFYPSDEDLEKALAEMGVTA